MTPRSGTGRGVHPACAISIELGNPREEAVARLLSASEEYSHELYPPESIHTLPVDQLDSPSVHFLVARCQHAGTVVGCGAILFQDDAYGEIKRMFVAPGCRGRGIGADILGALERVARSRGIGILRLETGISQPAAVGLYRRFGYRERGPFGSYRDDPLSIFMEKQLA